MKKDTVFLLKFVAIGLFGLIGLSACENGALENFGANDVSNVETEVAMDEAFEEVDDLTFAIMEQEGIDGGRIANNDLRFSCSNVSVSHDPSTKTVVIDFGDGCEGPYGRVRKGALQIVYNGKRFEPGSVVTTTLVDFYLDEKKIEGTRTVTNVSATLQDHPSFNVVITDGKVIWPDETFATRSVDRVKTWIRANNPIEDEFHFEGTANGVNRRGVSYTSTINETIVFKRSCRENEVFIPVQGVKTISTERRDVSFDFGTGACDRLVTVSVNGISKEVTF